MSGIPVTPNDNEARLSYEPGEFRVIRPGRFVRCGVTGAPIPLEELRYWSIQNQEAYVSAEVALRRYRQTCHGNTKG